jgi:hypothetical protein
MFVNDFKNVQVGSKSERIFTVIDWPPGSESKDPEEIIMDPQHCWKLFSFYVSPVAKSGNISHLGVGEAEELVPVLVLHLHDVEHALHPLLHASLDDLQRNVQ